jgi:predicted transcriptional regulator
MITKIEEQRLIELRRSRVLEMSAKGFNQSEIARELNVTEATISRDMKILRTQAKENIRKFIDEQLPDEYNKTLVGITSILKEAFITAKNAVAGKDRIQALSLAKDCYNMKLELLTNASVVEEAVKFVEDKKGKSMFSRNRENIGERDK